MIKITIKLDKRRRLNNGKFPLKYKIARRDRALYIPSGIELKEEEWDEKNEKIRLLPDKKMLNARISKRLVFLNGKIAELQESGTLRLYTNKRLVQYLACEETEEEAKQQLVKTQFDNFLATKDKQSTVKIYRSVESKLKGMCDYDNLRLNDIDIDWIDNYVEIMKTRGNKKNTIAANLRCIRSVLNFARKRGLLEHYVFSLYHINLEDTPKRSLTAEQLRILWNAELSKIRSKHRDIFFLTFFLMGINLVDLSQLKGMDNGRITYRRAKTGTLYDIKIEPEAKIIIDRYRGKQHLLSVFDKTSDYRHYATYLNSALRMICLNLGLPPITSYWARHSFATIAYEIGINMDTIADCLGHKGSHRITEIYVRKDQQKIDEANRRVIDYVLYNKR